LRERSLKLKRSAVELPICGGGIHDNYSQICHEALIDAFSVIMGVPGAAEVHKTVLLSLTVSSFLIFLTKVCLPTAGQYI